jgi:hypothetical protein
MFPCIETLASEIDAAWARVGYAEDDFCELAAECLSKPFSSDFSFSNLARRICEGMELPEQRRSDEGFGQPSLTLHHGERFLIEALCWHSGTPAIHQHSFSGAFRIVTGQSVHTRYSFTPHCHLDRITLGELRLESIELLDDSTTVLIPQGSALIHSAFHLDSPSMTLVVRTHQTADPELTYLPPGIAYDSAARTPGLIKRIQMLDTLNETSHESYLECVHAAITHADVSDGMNIVMRQGSHRVDDRTFLRFLDHLGSLHGSGIDPLLSALVEERRRSSIVRRRAMVVDRDTRFFLAILLSFSARSDLLHAMAQRYGDEDAARDRTAAGVSSLIGGDDDRRFVIATAARAMLEDVPAPTFPRWVAALWDRTLTVDEEAKLERLYQQLSAHPFLTPLLKVPPHARAPFPNMPSKTRRFA